MDLVGNLLGNRYEVIEKIGDGGMATVYKAKDKVLNRKVAIKVLKEEYSNDQEFIKRFQIEAQSAASLSHPNIVSIYDVANEKDLHYIVMELIEGKTLKEFIKESGKLEWKQAVEIASQIASGLAQAHKNHIIHRDIKPHNIIMTKDGISKITDFGIAKAVTSSTINASNSTLGSVHYFSPEHARGGYTDEKSDIYSLGVVLYEMVTGKLPFESDTPVSVALKHLQEKPVSPIEITRDIPMGLNDIILKAMQKEVAERYASASEMYSDLQKILRSPNTLNVGGIKNMDDKKYATQKVPVIGANTRGAKNSNIEGDNDYMGKTKKKKRTKKQALLRVVLYLILAIGIICLSAFATTKILGGAFEGKDDVKVPKLVEMHKDEATKMLEELGLKLEIQANVVSNEYPKDYIVSQAYAEGYRLKAGSTVGVTLSKGAKQVQVPDVTTMSLDAAKIEIEKYGLVFKIAEEANSEVAEGEIIRQEPVYNTDLAEGEIVTVFVSTGVPDGIIVVPDVTMYDETTARQILTQANLIPVVTYAAKYSEAEGKILSQTPEKDTKVSELTEISLVINKYEEQEPENPEDNAGDGENNNNSNDNNENSNDNSDNNSNNNEEPNDALTHITIDLTNKGTRDSFTVKVEVQGDLSGKKIIHEETHTRSEGKIKVPVPKNTMGLIRVFIDDELDSEMVI